MTSTTSSVSPGRQILGVFRWQLRRSAGITAVYAAILLLSYPVLLLFTLSGRNNYYYEGMSEAQLYEITVNNVVISTRAATTILGISAMILFALIFTLTNFGFLHRKREVDLFHAMPVSRTALFYGRFLSGYLCLYAPLLLAVLLQGIVAACFGVLAPEVLTLLFSILTQLLVMTAAVFSFTVFVAVCSGSTMDTLVSIVLISVTWPALIFVGTAVINNTIPGIYLNYSPYLVGALSPLAAAYVQSSFYTFQWLFSLWWVALTAALLLGAAAMYRRRKSESAESSVSFGPSKVVIRIFSCAAGGLCFGYLLFQLTNSTLSYYLGALLFSALAYLVTELLYWKSLKQLFRHSIPYCGVLAVFLAFTLTVSLGAFGMDTYVPPSLQIENAGAFNNNVYSYMAETPVLTEQEAAKPERDRVYETIRAAVQNPELIDQVRQANEKFIAYERTRQFPYLIGRNSLPEPSLYRYTLCYELSNSDNTTDRSYVLFSNAGDEAKALYLEGKQLTDKVLTSDEYIRGLFPVNAVDAASWVTHYANEEPENDGEKQAVSTNPGSDTVEFSGLKNESDFRKQLEQCLLDDFRNGRYLAEDGSDAGDTYEIMYSGGKHFTARGGLKSEKSIEGQSFVLCSSLSCTVTSSMTSTYQLLESLYA